jgi:hypothetical protein
LGAGDDGWVRLRAAHWVLLVVASSCPAAAIPRLNMPPATEAISVCKQATVVPLVRLCSPRSFSDADWGDSLDDRPLTETCYLYGSNVIAWSL